MNTFLLIFKSSAYKNLKLSRRISRQLSDKNDSNDMDNDFGCAVTSLRFLNTRTYGKDCNLVSCGGNGWVRFWEVSTAKVCGEFIAHAQGKLNI
jgi:hypothetical protein